MLIGSSESDGAGLVLSSKSKVSGSVSYLILIGFSGGFRRNEIVSLDYDDLNFVSEGLKINIRRSKTDQYGEGSVKALPYFDNIKYCPVITLKKWIEKS